MEFKTKSGNSYNYNPGKSTFRFNAKNTKLEVDDMSHNYDSFEDISECRKGRILLLWLL